MVIRPRREQRSGEQHSGRGPEETHKQAVGRVMVKAGLGVQGRKASTGEQRKKWTSKRDSVTLKPILMRNNND